MQGPQTQLYRGTHRSGVGGTGEKNKTHTATHFHIHSYNIGVRVAGGQWGGIWFHRRLNSGFLDSNFFFFTAWNCSVNPLQDDKAPASHSERRRSHNSKQVAAEQAGIIIRARWCATAECYGLHCLFKSMLGGLCSFTKEGWLGSKASEAKAAKKVLQTQLSLWPEGIPARHQPLYSWPKFCYDLKKKKTCGGVRFRPRNKLGVEWNPKRKRLFFSEAAVSWWRQLY